MPDDVGAVGHQPLGQRRSDEARRAGHQRLHANRLRTRSGRRQGRPSRSSAACTVRPSASSAASAGRTTSYANCHAHGRHQLRRRPYLDLIVVPRRLAIVAVRLDDRQHEPVGLHRSITPAGVAQQVRACDLEPHEVVGVVDDTHLVGFRVAHAQPRRGSGSDHLAAAASPPCAAAFRARGRRSRDRAC